MHDILGWNSTIYYQQIKVDVVCALESLGLALCVICEWHQITELFNINIYKGILLLIKERELESSEITALVFVTLLFIVTTVPQLLWS